MVPGKNGPGKIVPKKNGPRETQKRKIVGWASSIVVCVWNNRMWLIYENPKLDNKHKTRKQKIVRCVECSDVINLWKPKTRQQIFLDSFSVLQFGAYVGSWRERQTPFCVCSGINWWKWKSRLNFLAFFWRRTVFKGDSSGDHFSGDQFSGDHFSGDQFPGTIFPGDHFSRVPFFRRPIFRDHFSGTIFPGTNFPGTTFSRTKFIEVADTPKKIPKIWAQEKCVENFKVKCWYS